jgi:hypothetical protein
MRLRGAVACILFFELRCEALIRRTFEDAIRVRDRNHSRQPQSCAHEQARVFLLCPLLSASEHQHVGGHDKIGATAYANLDKKGT